MIRPALIGLCLAASTPALAEPPAYAAYWADPAFQDCALAGEVGEGTPMLIETDAIYGLEFSCDLIHVDPVVPGRAWTVVSACLDMGETYYTRSLWVMPTPDQLIDMSMDDASVVTTLTRCEAPQ